MLDRQRAYYKNYDKRGSSAGKVSPTENEIKQKQIINEEKNEANRQNLMRKKRIQNGYKNLLVEDLMHKKSKAESLAELK